MLAVETLRTTEGTVYCWLAHCCPINQHPWWWITGLDRGTPPQLGAASPTLPPKETKFHARMGGSAEPQTLQRRPKAGQLSGCCAAPKRLSEQAKSPARQGGEDLKIACPDRI